MPYYQENLTSIQGEPIKLIAELYPDIISGKTHIDVWGRISVNGETHNLRLPPAGNKKGFLKKHGSITAYLDSPDRGLLHHVPIGRYLAFATRALNPNSWITSAEILKKPDTGALLSPS